MKIKDMNLENYDFYEQGRKEDVDRLCHSFLGHLTTFIFAIPLFCQIALNVYDLSLGKNIYEILLHNLFSCLIIVGVLVISKVIVVRLIPYDYVKGEKYYNLYLFYGVIFIGLASYLIFLLGYTLLICSGYILIAI